MTTTYSTTRDKLISGALRVIGVVAQGETPTATQIDEGAEALNYLVKAWQADGMPLWALKQTDIPLTASTSTYRLGVGQAVDIAKPLRIIQTWFHNGTSNIDIPMLILTRDEYNRLGNKTALGQPVQFYYDVQNTYGDLHVFPVPDVIASDPANSVRISYQRPFEDFNNASDTPDFPQEWFLPLKFGLAEVLAPEYGVPLEQYGYLRKVTKEYKDAALNMGIEEGSFYFSVNRQGW